MDFKFLFGQALKINNLLKPNYTFFCKFTLTDMSQIFCNFNKDLKQLLGYYQASQIIVSSPVWCLSGKDWDFNPTHDMLHQEGVSV